jgi:plasmid stabilization system protein ParE
VTLYTDPRADEDVVEAGVWLEGLNPGSAASFVAALNLTLSRPLQNPRSFPRVNRSPRGREFRHGLVDGYLFLITYERTATQFVVWSVGHARQRSQPGRRRMRSNP